MKTTEQLLTIYGESHQNKLNKIIHWICVPAILFSLTGLLMHIPFPDFIGPSLFLNWAGIILVLSLIYYFRLSFSLFLGFLVISILLLYLNSQLMHYCNLKGCSSLWTIIGIFIIAWIGQFIGHKIEGKKPSFLNDLQFLLIGPAWLLHFVYKKVGVPY